MGKEGSDDFEMYLSWHSGMSDRIAGLDLYRLILSKNDLSLTSAGRELAKGHAHQYYKRVRHYPGSYWVLRSHLE